MNPMQWMEAREQHSGPVKIASIWKMEFQNTYESIYTSTQSELALNLNLDFFPRKNRPYDVISKVTLESVGSSKKLHIAKGN